MTTLTIRIPENKAARLKQFAKKTGISVNKLFEEFATIALAQHDAESRFRLLAAKGSAKKGIELLDKLDSHFGSNTRN